MRPHSVRRASAVLAGGLALALALPAAPALAVDPSPTPSATPSASPTPTPSPTRPSPAPTTSPTRPTPTPTPSPTRPTPAPTKPPKPIPDVLRFPMEYGTRSTYVRLLHKRLKWLGYEISAREYAKRKYGRTTQQAVRAYQVKFFSAPTGVVTRSTWFDIKRTASPLGRLPRACTEQTSLCIDKSQKLLRYVKDGRVVMTVDARFGTSSTPTREGTFSVYRKSRDHYSSLYGSWMPFAMFFSGGQAVHYSPYFARDGYYGGSHGCVGVRDFDRIKWLYDRIPLGTRVYVYRS